MDDEPTLPNLRAQRAGGAPVWPPPRPQPPRAEGLPVWRGVLLFVVVALLSFGMVRGVGMVLAQHANGITVPAQPTQPANGSGVPSLPTATPAETAQPTPTSGGGGD